MKPNLSFDRRVTRKFVLTVLVCLAGVSLVAVLGLRAWINKNSAVFTTTISPQNTYSLNLKGAKQRPFLLPFSVSADVYKMGELFVTDVWLHTAWDAFDLSFELGYPDIRWPANNVVEFYRPDYFADGSDLLIIQNRSGQPVKCLLIEAVNKFLVFDMRPGASLSVHVPKSRGDWQWFALEGVVADGTRIPRNNASFRSNNKQVRCTYLITLLDSGSTFEARTNGCS